MTENEWSCPQCGRKDAAIDAALLCVAAKLLSNATTPRWTTEPPTEPGWYWTQWKAPDFEEPMTVREITHKDLPIPVGAHRRWWPVRIEEPPREETQ